MFSYSHISAILLLILSIILLYRLKDRIHLSSNSRAKIEYGYAFSLLIMECFYHLWLIGSSRWSIKFSLPLELCSITVILAIILLFSGNKYIYDIVFYAGIGGAIQAVLTPDLEVGFPHFRFFHFFYSHSGIILTACYFTWMKGYVPTIKGLFRTFLLLNLLLPFIYGINVILESNYMFLIQKPIGGSLLDYLGPHPWYILSLEIAALVTFFLLFFLFRGKELYNDKKRKLMR